MTSRGLATVLLLALSALAAPAAAYTEMDRFAEPPDLGGGGGRRFTGAPGDGYTCAVCHDGAAAEIAITGLPDAGYRPGMRYALELAWPDATGDAGLAFEVSSPSGGDAGAIALVAETALTDDERCRPVGGAPAVPATRLFAATGGRTVLGTDSCGADRARVEWTAPATGAGTVWMHAAAAFSNANGSSRGDRVAIVARPLVEEGAPRPELSVVGGGCSVLGPEGPRPATPLAPPVLVLVLVLAFTRRHTRRPRHRSRAAALPRTLAVLATLFTLSASTPARAVPGPDSTAVLANANDPESVALAERYAAARDIPDRQVCALAIDPVVDLSLDAYRAQIETPLAACLETAGVLDRIEAVVIARGVPLRVTIPTAGGDQRVSLAAALGVWRSTRDDAPLLGEDPGNAVPCPGGTCYGARFQAPFRSGIFEPGWMRVAGAITWRPLLVTMLHGRSYADAGTLVDSAIASEGAGAPGEILLMEGADGARNVLDFEYTRVLTELGERGVTDATRVPFDPELGGRTLAAFFTGTASIGTTIEANDFHPGALVDNVTSFGAVPENFEPSGESQVSIARWVARGVAGVHGTTDEPLNSVFPSRMLIVDYVDGATLGEAFHRRLPFVYWRNLVLGDPIAAPYAVRPAVVIEGVLDGTMVGDARPIVVRAMDPEGLGVDSLTLYVDGVEVAHVDGDVLLYCLRFGEARTVEVLAVAQKHDDGSSRGLHRPKGWAALEVVGGPGSPVCDETDGGATLPDAGGDAGRTDAGGPPMPSGGCSCRAAAGPPAPRALIVLLAVVTWRRLRVGTRSRA